MPQPEQTQTHNMHTCSFPITHLITDTHTCTQPPHSPRLTAIHVSLCTSYVQTMGKAMRVPHCPILKGLTVRLAELNKKQLPWLLSSSRFACKCFRSINSFSPHLLGDKVSIIINRYHCYYYLTDENSEAERQVTNPESGRAGMQAQGSMLSPPLQLSL